jgi:predicted 2-oxoglutarate/Fe(II)-dependent dioxygenase YbiX
VARRRQLGIGERSIDFVLPGASGSPERFYAYAGGRPTVIVFDDGGWGEQFDALADRLRGRDDVALHRVTAKRAAEPAVFRTWSDPERTVAGAYGLLPGTSAAVVLDPNLRIVGIVGVVAGADLASAVAELLDHAGHRDEPVEIRAQAPVLLVPRMFDPAHRDELIRVWHEAGATATGVARQTGDGLDEAVKKRVDHVVRDPDLLRRLTTTVGRRLLPEVRKAFAFDATRFEGFKIACYDASTGGYFRSHRDNLAPATAHRAFALTLNLNDDYDGGQLRFPEYGNDLYRPDAGAALVFSCAHLHEVLDVTAGRRFVLLSFLYSEPPVSAM